MSYFETLGRPPSLEDLLSDGSSVEGFLAKGQSLERVIRRDQQVLTILGYTTMEVRNLLEEVIGAGNAYGGEYIAPNRKEFTVTTARYLGWQECPWNDGYMSDLSSMDFYVRENKGYVGGRKKLEGVRIAGLLLHLIESHSFFEGGSYRVAPEDIVEMFGVERNPGSIEEARKIPL